MPPLPTPAPPSSSNRGKRATRSPDSPQNKFPRTNHPPTAAPTPPAALGQSTNIPRFPAPHTPIVSARSPAKRLTVLGDNGMICRSYVSRFPIGTEWVLAVSPDEWSKKSELAISACGEYALPVEGNAVKGRITLKAKDAESMTLTNLRKLLKVKPQVAGADGAKGQCVDRVTKASV